MARAVAGAVVALLVLPVAGCQSTGLGGGSGQLSMRVAFPHFGFHTMLIPVQTKSIVVVISGEGMTSSRQTTLTREQPSTLLSLPTGTKNIDVRAVGSLGETLAAGSAVATVIEATKTTAVVTLEPVNNDDEPTPDSSSDPNATGDGTTGDGSGTPSGDGSNGNPGPSDPTGSDPNATDNPDGSDPDATQTSNGGLPAPVQPPCANPPCVDTQINAIDGAPPTSPSTVDL